MKILNSILEYVVWLLPVLFVPTGRYKITRENGKISGIFLIVSSLVLTGISVSVKNVLILNSSLKHIEAVLIGNSLILSSYILLLLSVFKIEHEIKKFVKIPRIIIIYSLPLFSLVAYALLNKEYLIFFDLLIYAILIIVTIICIGSMYILIKERKRVLKTLIFLFALSLIVDFFLKSLSEMSLPIRFLSG